MNLGERSERCRDERGQGEEGDAGSERSLNGAQGRVTVEREDGRHKSGREGDFVYVGFRTSAEHTVFPRMAIRVGLDDGKVRGKRNDAKWLTERIFSHQRSDLSEKKRQMHKEPRKSVSEGEEKIKANDSGQRARSVTSNG